MDKGFIMYYESEDMINLLSNEELGDLIKQVYGYYKRGEEPTNLSPIQRAVFYHIREQMTCSKKSTNAERQQRYRDRKKALTTQEPNPIINKEEGERKAILPPRKINQ